MISEDTIAAISTPRGAGAIAIVRISGPESLKIIAQIFSSSSTDPDQSIEWSARSHEAIHGYIFCPEERRLIDEVVAIAYIGSKTYTGEDLVEVNCHGSPLIATKILNTCMTLGARLAQPGEFTKRAFLAGRMDLTQAEAVLDLIQAKTERQARLSLSALDGHLGRELKQVRTNLMELLAGLVAGIDFPEEVGEMPTDDIEPIVSEARARLVTLSKTSRSGRFLREGLKLSIVGRPNAGKSSLLNNLLNFDRAIVTDVPGTTRDSIEELLDIKGIPVTLVDTAGVRITDDQVEIAGIERTTRAINESDLVLFVVDVTEGWEEAEAKIAGLIESVPHIVAINKIDLLEEDRNVTPSTSPMATLCVSAVTGKGVDSLTDAIEKFAIRDNAIVEAGASLNQRQAQLCTRSISDLDQVLESIKNRMPEDCIATDLKSAIHCLSEACGDEVTEEVITEVFARFCIGK